MLTAVYWSTLIMSSQTVQTSKKNLIGFFGGMPGNQLSFWKRIYQDNPAHLYKLYYMLTRIVGKGKFLFVQDFKVNKWIRSSRIWIAPFLKHYLSR